MIRASNSNQQLRSLKTPSCEQNSSQKFPFESEAGFTLIELLTVTVLFSNALGHSLL